MENTNEYMKIIHLNCGERYKDMIRSYTQNLTVVKLKPEKKQFSPERDLNNSEKNTRY